MVAGKRLKQRERNRGRNTAIAAGSSPAVGPSDAERPVFSFHHTDAKYCVTNCQMREQADVALALHRRSEFSWRDLRQMSREALGYEKIARDAIRAAIPATFSEDEVPISFRMSDRGRLVGFRRDATFHIVWVDTKFEVYPH